MPLYRYTAYARDGSTQQGQEMAANPENLERQLRGRKLTLIEQTISPTQSLPRKFLLRLIAQLNPLLGSGIVVDRALQILADDPGDAAYGEFLTALREAVKRGQQLSQALDDLGCRDALATAVLRAGEASGQMAEVLATLDTHYQQQQKLRGEIMSALLYPAMLVVLSLLSIIVLAIYVIPTFQGLFADRTQLLSWNAKLIFGFSNFILAYGWQSMVAVAVLLAAAYGGFKRNPAWRAAWHRRQLSLPLFAQYGLPLMVSQILTLLAIQLRNGVPLVQALELAGDSPRNSFIKERMQTIQNEVRRGRPLSLAMRNFPQMPNLALRYLAIGEETGRLSEMCEKSGQQLAAMTALRAKNFTAILGPAIILVMGFLIAFIVISMLTAVYGLTALAPS